MGLLGWFILLCIVVCLGKAFLCYLMYLSDKREDNKKPLHSITGIVREKEIETLDYGSFHKRIEWIYIEELNDNVTKLRNFEINDRPVPLHQLTVVEYRGSTVVNFRRA